MAVSKSVCLTLLFLSVLFSGGCSQLREAVAPKGGHDVDSELTEAEKTRAQLLRKIDKKYENPEAHYELGSIYQADGLWAEAENQYRIALNFDPVHRKAQAGRVAVLQRAGDTGKAGTLAEIYIEQTASSALGSLKLALAFQGQMLDDYALQCYRQALNLSPNSAKVNRQIGFYYLSRGDRTQAKSYLQRSFQLDPGQPQVAHQLGRLGVAIKVPRGEKRPPQQLDEAIDRADKELTEQP